MSWATDSIQNHGKIVSCVYKYIDRMMDTCEEDTAEKVLCEFTKDVLPLLDEEIKLERIGLKMTDSERMKEVIK